MPAMQADEPQRYGGKPEQWSADQDQTWRNMQIHRSDLCSKLQEMQTNLCGTHRDNNGGTLVAAQI